MDSLPLINSTTRIDSGLELADKVLFQLQNGARTFTRKILVVFTDGKQTKAEGRSDIDGIVDDLRDKDIK